MPPTQDVLLAQYLARIIKKQVPLVLIGKAGSVPIIEIENSLNREGYQKNQPTGSGEQILDEGPFYFMVDAPVDHWHEVRDHLKTLPTEALAWLAATKGQMISWNKAEEVMAVLEVFAVPHEEFPYGCQAVFISEQGKLKPTGMVPLFWGSHDRSIFSTLPAGTGTSPSSTPLLSSEVMYLTALLCEAGLPPQLGLVEIARTFPSDSLVEFSTQVNNLKETNPETLADLLILTALRSHSTPEKAFYSRLASTLLSGLSAVKDLKILSEIFRETDSEEQAGEVNQLMVAMRAVAHEPEKWKETVERAGFDYSVRINRVIRDSVDLFIANRPDFVEWLEYFELKD